MAAPPENTCIPQSLPTGAPAAAKRRPPLSVSLPENQLSVPEMSPQMLQEFNQLRERFARTTNALASAAHDLKTPLAILNGYVEVLQSEKLGTLNPRQQEVLRDMRSSGQRLQHFIQDFLTYSVLETGELKLHYETGDMNACLAEVCRLWSPRFQERGIALYFLPHEKLNDFAFDAAKIERVIFEPSGKRLEVHALRRHRLAARRALHVGTPLQPGKRAR